MSDLADLFPGYESRWINTSAGRIFGVRFAVFAPVGNLPNRQLEILHQRSGRRVPVDTAQRDQMGRKLIRRQRVGYPQVDLVGRIRRAQVPV